MAIHGHSFMIINGHSWKFASNKGNHIFCAIYPKYLVNLATICTFTSSKDENEDGNRKDLITSLAGQ